MGQTTIPAVVRDAAAKFGSAEALVDGELRLGFAQLLERVQVVARAFVARGVEPGDRVAITLPNTHHWVLTALGALYAGATLVPVNTRFTAAETVDLLVRGRARALVVAADFLGADRLAAIVATGAQLPDLRTVVRVPLEQPHRPVPGTLGWDEFLALAEQVPEAEAEARADAVKPDDVSDILFTSGTTGRSKGVLSAHRQALDVAAAWADCGRVTDGDRYLVVNPFFHSFGYKAGILVGLLTGATIVPQAVFDVRQALDVIDPRTDHRAARRADRLPVPAARARPRRTCRRCGSRSPGRPRSRPSLVDRMRSRAGLRDRPDRVRADRSRGRRRCAARATTRSSSRGRPAGRPPASRWRSTVTRARSCCAGPTSCSATSTIPKRPQRPSTRTAGCTPATSASSTPPVT